MPSVEQVVVLPYVSGGEAAGGGTLPAGLPEGAISWQALLETEPGTELDFTRVPFSHPLWILYSSGTTGLPKAIVQGQGGILLEHLKKMNLHLDAQTGDRVFWFTTTGWMMWNFLASCLLTDAAIVLYDGNPGHPDMETLWQLAADAEVTCFGTSASYIAACMKAGVEPAGGRDLSRLRSVGSTGSPLAPEGFDWIYEQLGDDTWLFSTSGGTDLCTAFVGGVPTLPVYRGELQARALGAAVESWDEDGQPHTGEVGELVITKPMPSMPLFLWGDEDGSRYRESYFDTYPGIWRHGDWIEITERGTAIIYGRSDSTINRGGIRMGTSEIYRAVLADPDIVDALVVDIPRPGTEGWMPLFVVLAEGAELDDDLKDRVAREIREYCSPRHVPNEMVAIEAVPRTLSGKVLEVPVKRILTGTPAGEGGQPRLAGQPREPRLLRRVREDADLGRPTAPARGFVSGRDQRRHRQRGPEADHHDRPGHVAQVVPAGDHDTGPDQQSVGEPDQTGRPAPVRRRGEPEGEADREGGRRVAARVADLDRVPGTELALEPGVGQHDLHQLGREVGQHDHSETGGQVGRPPPVKTQPDQDRREDQQRPAVGEVGGRVGQGFGARTVAREQLRRGPRIEVVEAVRAVEEQRQQRHPGGTGSASKISPTARLDIGPI